MTYNLTGKRIYIAGHNGMVGSALLRRLAAEDCTLLTTSRDDLDLRAQADVRDWFAQYKPQAVILAAARVGGILDNMTYPVDYLQDNLQIETNIIAAAYQAGAEKLLFLGSSCIYPKNAPQPISEDSLLTAALEPSNEWYAIAKIAGIKLCQAYRAQYGADFISAMPTNLYGPHDNFDLVRSHVIAALLRKIHAAKTSGAPTVDIWGDGSPLREFMHVDDLADALIFLLKNYSDAAPVNVGVCSDLSITALAGLLRDIIGYTGGFTYDRSKPNGTMRKLLDSTRLRALGWQPQIDLRQGLSKTYEWYKESISSL